MRINFMSSTVGDTMTMSLRSQLRSRLMLPPRD